MNSLSTSGRWLENLDNNYLKLLNENVNFEETTLEIPIGSGPYKIKSFDAGRSITYELNKDYWGFDIPIKKGTENFGLIK